MKTLEELGISPAPWIAKNILGHRVFNGDGFELCDSDSVFSANDARLIAASPKLYECLCKAVVCFCENAGIDGHGETHCCRHLGDGDVCTFDGECECKKWRAALAEAAGEEVSDGK